MADGGNRAYIKGDGGRRPPRLSLLSLPSVGAAPLSFQVCMFFLINLISVISVEI
jgi:hypothetical protein